VKGLSVLQLEILIGILIIVRILIRFFKLSEIARSVSYEYLDSIIVAGLTALFLINYVVRTFYIPSGSMKPTLLPNDYILVNEFLYRFRAPERGDVIVFKPPLPKAPDYIKRLIGKGGEKLEVKKGKVYINDTPIVEPYIMEMPDYDYGPVIIPPEHYFVMGDNRNNSEDSHIWGFLPKKNIVGKAFLIFWPPRRIGLIH